MGDNNFIPTVGQPFDPLSAHRERVWVVDLVEEWAPNVKQGIPRLSDAAKRVYQLFWGTAVRADRKKRRWRGYLYYSQREIGRRLGKEVRAVQRAIKELERLGLIRVSRPNKDLNNEYRLLWHSMFADEYDLPDTSHLTHNHASGMAHADASELTPEHVEYDASIKECSQVGPKLQSASRNPQVDVSSLFKQWFGNTNR